MSQKESQADLSKKLAEAAKRVTLGARYMHYKQLPYKVLDLAILESNAEPCVVYQAEYGERITFIRLVSSWIEEVELDGRRVKRFEKTEVANKV